VKNNRGDSFVFHTTALSPCPYLPNRQERKIVTELTQGDPDRFHDILSQSGFRRSHRIAYAPTCPGCNACMPARVRVADTKHSKSFRRILRNNSDLIMKPVPPQSSGEQHRLFMNYQEFRHAGGDMATMTYGDYRSMVEDSPIHTFIYEYRGPNGALVASVLIDAMSDGLSAVYSFFKTDEPKRSLGTYIVLTLIEACRALNLPYLYLGYWIKDCQKMSYKRRFQPLEIYGPQGWLDMEPE